MSWKKLGDAASNVVNMIRPDKVPPEHRELCEDLADIIDSYREDTGLRPGFVLSALCHAQAYLIGQMNPDVDAEMEQSLFAAVSEVMALVAEYRKEAAQ